MAKDAETGVDPKAKDGVPSEAEMENEIQRRRDAKEARERDEEAQVTDGKRGQPIDGQEAETGEEDDGQLFVWEQGRKVTLGTLVGRGLPVEHAFVFGGKRLKGSGGLVAFDDDVLVVVRGKVSHTNVVATRDDDERVTKVTIETHVASKVVAPADSEQAMQLLAGVFAQRGIKAA